MTQAAISAVDLTPIISGEPSATEHFVRTHSPWMLTASHRILWDDSLAEDAVQTAFSKIFNALLSYEGRASLETWMRRIVINEALMLLRKRKGRNETPIEEYQPEFDNNGCRLEEPWPVPPTPEAMLQTAQMQNAVLEKINLLPDQYRAILVLRDIEELSTLETADLLELSEANVKVRLHRARAALKKLLEPLMREQAL